MITKEFINNFITNTVKVIFILIIFFLLVMSIANTCTTDYMETTYYLKDSAIKNFFVIFLVIIICGSIGLISKTMGKDTKKKSLVIARVLAITITLIWLAFSIKWIQATKLMPRADQFYVLNAAENIENKNYSDLEQGGYLNIYPDQSGIVLFMYLWGKIFGVYNYVSLQMLNVFAVIVSYIFIFLICKEVFQKLKKIELYAIYMGLLMFIQMTFYTTFVYGNLLGFMFSVIAIYAELRYLKKEKILNIIISFICIELAILVKSNYLITLIAMCILLLYKGFNDKKMKNIILTVILIIVYVLGNKAVIFSMKIITGKELGKGVPKLAWIEMSLQEGGYASGWYNGYNRIVYMQNNCNTEQTKEVVKSDLVKTINQYRENPNKFQKYMLEKIVSQWNNPTFQCIWVNQNRKTEIEVPKWAKDIIIEDGKYNQIVEFTNILQTIILFGVFVYIILNYQRLDFTEIFFAVIFIGGFLFHIIWEAKCQYTVMYFILIIPYSIRGYFSIMELFRKEKELN